LPRVSSDARPGSGLSPTVDVSLRFAMTPIDIASRFQIPQPVSVEPFGGGLLHATHNVRTNDGAFVLQRLHPVTTDAAIQDARVVGEFLASRGFQVPVPRLSKDGA